MTRDRVFLLILSISGAIAVGLGAFGTHGLQGRLSAGALETYETAVRYQFYHTFGLLAVVVALTRWPASKLAGVAGWLFVAGIVLFSGSLYLLAMSGVTWLGAITPLGGVAFITGWILLATVAWRGR